MKRVALLAAFTIAWLPLLVLLTALPINIIHSIEAEIDTRPTTLCFKGEGSSGSFGRCPQPFQPISQGITDFVFDFILGRIAPLFSLFLFILGLLLEVKKTCQKNGALFLEAGLFAAPVLIIAFRFHLQVLFEVPH
jgi:hypothetical protein